jgi:plastocyanin
MRQSILLAAMASASVSYAATATIKASGLVFQPASATAAVGDVIEFHFLPSNHSAVMSDFSSPCKPAGSGKGFSSGFWPSQSGENVRHAFQSCRHVIFVGGMLTYDVALGRGLPSEDQRHQPDRILLFAAERCPLPEGHDWLHQRG